MNGHTVLYRQVTGPRGGKKFVQQSTITHGAFCIRTPGIYKATRFINGWASEPNVFEITEADLDKATWAPGQVGPHGLGIEIPA